MNAHNHTSYGSTLVKQDWIAAGIIAVVLLICGAYRMTPGVTGTYHDDGIYVSTARALAEGQGYRLINLPGTPLQTKYPFLYPLVLAAVWKLWPTFPQNVVVMQCLTLLTASLAIGLSYLYFVRFNYCSRWVAFGIGLLCATSPDITYFSTITMAEMPFTLATVVALWRLELAMAAPLPARRALLTGATLAAPFLCRELGAAIAAAGLATLALSKRPFLWVAVGAAAVAAPWVAWSVRAWGTFERDVVSGYYTDYFGAWVTLISAAGPIQLVTVNLRDLLVNSSTKSLPGLIAWLTGAGFPTMALSLVLGMWTWGTAALHVARCRVLPSCLLAYALVITLWPWPPGRFLVPLLPLILVCLTIGLRDSIGRLIPYKAAARLAVAAFALSVAANLALVVRLGATSQRYGYPSAILMGPGFSWTSFEALFQWVKTHTEEQDVVAAGLDTMCFLYTNRRAIRPFPYRPDALFYGGSQSAAGTPEELVALLRQQQVRYLVETPMLIAQERSFELVVREVQSRYPALLAQVYRGPDPRFAVYEVHGQWR